MRRSRTLCTLMVLMIVVVGCGKEEPQSRQRNSPRRQTRSASNGPGGPQRQLAAVGDITPFTSNDGGYSLALPVAPSAAVALPGAEGAIQEFVRKHSAGGQWTYIMHPVNLVNPATGKVEIPEAGVDQFCRLFGDDIAQVVIKWAPIVYDVASEFEKAKPVLIREGGRWVDGSDRKATVGGSTAMVGKYQMNIGDQPAYNTFILVHSARRRYEIAYSYTGGFQDPEGTPDRLIRGISFKDGPEGEVQSPVRNGQADPESSGGASLDATGDYYSSEQGHFSIPLDGGVETWTHKTRIRQEEFSREEGDRVHIINIQWDPAEPNKALLDVVRARKITAAALGSTWRAGFESPIQIGGRPAIKYGYENRLAGTPMYTTCAAVRTASRRYVITVMSTTGYPESESLFNTMCTRIRFKRAESTDRLDSTAAGPQQKNDSPTAEPATDNQEAQSTAVRKALESWERDRSRSVHLEDVLKTLETDMEKNLQINPMAHPEEVRAQISRIAVDVENTTKVVKEEILKADDPDMKEKLAACLPLLEGMSENLKSYLTMLDSMGRLMNPAGHDQGEAEQPGRTEKLATGPAPGAVRMAFVNDGKIVLVRADGTRIQTDLQGESPSLSADGRTLAYTRMKLTDKVIPSLPTHPRYGLTCKTDGICLLDLASGRQTLVADDADDACLAPDGGSIVFTQNDTLTVKDLDTGRQQIIGKGDKACWLGSNAIVYENDFLVYRYDVVENRSQEVLQPPGVRLSRELGEDPARLKLHVFAGTTVSAQLGLCSFAGGRNAAFAQFEASITSGHKTVLITMSDQLVQTSPLFEVRGFDFNMTALDEMAVSPDGRQVVYLRAKQKGEMMPPERTAIAADGTKLGSVSHVNMEGTNNLYVAKRGSSSEQAPETIFLGTYSSAGRLTFWDNQTVLVQTLDRRQTFIDLGDSGTYVVGARALDPKQLAMMSLDAKIAEADMIHRVDLKSEQSQVWFSGHGLCVASGDDDFVTR